VLVLLLDAILVVLHAEAVALLLLAVVVVTTLPARMRAVVNVTMAETVAIAPAAQKTGRFLLFAIEAAVLTNFLAWTVMMSSQSAKKVVRMVPTEMIGKVIIHAQCFP